MKHFFPLLRGGLRVALVLLLAQAAARAQQAPAWTQLATATAATSNSFSYVLANAADAAGNVYLAGNFFGSVQFGSTVLTSTSAATDGFVAKCSSTTGTFVWAVALGGTESDQVSALALSNGAVYVGGFFASPTATLGPLGLANAGATGTGDAFVARLADAGPTASFVWAQQAGGPGTDAVTGLAVSGSRVYCTGFFKSAAFTAGGTVLANAAPGTSDAFVARLNDTGAAAGFAWAQRYGGPEPDEARALALSGSDLYVVGDFASPTLALGATVLTNISSGSADVFGAKLTDGGAAATVAWAQRAGSTGADTGDALALQGPNLYVAGSYGGATATVGPVLLPNTDGTSSTGDVFVAKLLDAGTSASVSWARAGGGPGHDQPRAVAVRGPAVYVAGSYSGPNATFGPTTLANRGMGAFTDIFVAKLLDTGAGASYAWAQSAGGPGGESAVGLALTGNLVVTTGGASSQAAFGPLSTPASVNNAAFVATILDAALPAATATALSGPAFALAPNPARGTTTVQLPALPGAPTATLTLHDALGRTVRTTTVALPAAGLRHELSLAGLPAGVYAVQVQAAGATATRKLVVE